MDSRPRSTTAVTACLLAAVLGLSTAPMVGAVVACVGADGHVEVQPSLCPCCSTAAPEAEGSAAEMGPPIPQCDGCVDVPLKDLPLKTKPQHLTTRKAAGDGRTATPSGGDDYRASPGPGRIGCRHRQSLALVSTVVLRT